MSRRLLLLSLAGALALPAAAPAQTRGQRSPDPSVEAEVFMSALEYIQRMHMQAYSDSTLWTRALDGLIEELGDPYAAVFSPAEVQAFREETTGNYAGIGVSISQLNDVVTITTVFRGTPAAQGGLQVGDVIVGVNQHDATTWNTGMASDSIRGPAGTPVEVRVWRGDVRQPLKFTLLRDSVHVAAVQSGILPGNVGYLVLDRVARNSAQEVMEALEALEPTRGIVIDLRRNPGGYLDESLAMADALLNRGVVLATTRNRARTGTAVQMSEESYRGRMRERVPGKPIIILVDRFTASAAEIVTGALQDHDRALVLGERTFGKGIVQSVVELPHGRQLRITTGSWHTPLGRSLHRERDAGGNALPEDLDTVPPVRTPGGRVIRSGGGIFPDLTIGGDTLSPVERELISAANEKEVPLGLKEAEAAFARAKTLRDTGQPPTVDEATFVSYLKTLEEAGLPGTLLERAESQHYLRWRLTVNVADRLEDFPTATMTRVERDPVLSRALELMLEATTQPELFASAARLAASAGADAGSSLAKR